MATPTPKKLGYRYYVAEDIRNELAPGYKHMRLAIMQRFDGKPDSEDDVIVAILTDGWTRNVAEAMAAGLNERLSDPLDFIGARQ